MRFSEHPPIFGRRLLLILVALRFYPVNDPLIDFGKLSRYFIAIEAKEIDDHDVPANDQ